MSEEKIKITGVCLDIPTIIKEAKAKTQPFEWQFTTTPGITFEAYNLSDAVRFITENKVTLCDKPVPKWIPAPEWISVAERLPEAGVDVLTFGDYGIQQGSYNPNCWSLCGGDTLACPEEVTHWCPLPAPPSHT